MSLRQRTLGWCAVGLTAAVVWLVIRPSYFFADDFVNFSVADEMGLSGTYLNRDIFGHWLPGRRLLDWALGTLEPVPWLLVITLEVSLLAISCVLLERLVRQLTGSQWLGLLGAAWLPLTSAIPATAQWWSAGSLSLSTLPLLLGACVLAVAYADRPSVGKLIGIAILTVAACLFDERAAALALTFPLLLVVLGRLRGRRLAALLSTSAVAVAAWYLAQRHYTVGTVQPPRSSPAEVLEFVSRGIGQAWLPSLAGVHVRPTALGDGALWIVGGLVAGALLGLMVLGRSWRAWLVGCWMVGTATVVLLPVGVARAHEFLPESALEPRYSAILMPFALIGVACLVAEAARTRRGRSWRSAGWTIIAVLLVVAVVPGMVHLSGHTLGRESRAYAENLTAAADREPDASFYDVSVPPWVVPPAFIPQSFLSRVLPTMIGARSTTVVTETALLPAPDGSAERSPLPNPRAGIMSGVAGAVEEQEDGMTCFSGGVVELTFPDASEKVRRLLQLQGRLGPTAEGVRFLAGPDPEHLSDVTDGAGFLRAPVPTEVWTIAIGPVDATTVQLRPEGHTPLCLSGVVLGTP